MSSFLPGLRRLALRVPTYQNACRQCLRQFKQPPTATALSPSPILQQTIWRASSTTPAQQTTLKSSVISAEVAKTASGSVHGTAKGSWPEASSKSVGYWLLGSAVSVFGIVVFGGLTRLTESGLSITEWKPDWESEFTKYKASPEFKLLNSHMDVEDFKQIYFYEWTHRLWGRLIGLSFVLPSIYFVARRRVTKRIAWNLLGISALIGFQGFIGWWMVKSGLKDDLFAPGSHPRVSQYRLATHLATAFVCYSWMLLAGLGILRTQRMLLNPSAALKSVEALKNPALKTLRRSVAALTVLVFITVLSGALVAGLDAGLIYNEFPKMGLGLTPPRSELWSDFYSRKEDRSDLWWRNMLENPSLVQLDHRILATTTFFAVLTLFAYARRGRVAAALPRDAKKGVMGLVHLACLQVALGISTLIYIVPIPLAAAHQAGALALLTGALVLGHRLRVPKPALAAVQRRLNALGAQSTR
ncbi:putative cytochrome c oxidase assembly protein [Xylariales sp. PMI_506]|nr:putative cytochrome c oxidase assembly protein [Xylariales sp. PMI_506]